MSITNASSSTDYIECLFIGEKQTLNGSSGIKGTPILSKEEAALQVERRVERGLRHFLIFGVPATKCIEEATRDTYCVNLFLQRTKERLGSEVTLIADVGLSPYQSSGQSVVYTDDGLDASLSYKAACALGLSFAAAGADYIAPCLSLPDQVLHLKQALAKDASSCGVIPYSTKFSSSLYGPYRQAIRSELGLVRKEYQSDYADCNLALKQMDDDIKSGAAVVIVKPALHYLDVIRRAKETAEVPVAAYHVSGEYMMAMLAAEHGLLDQAEYFDELHSALCRSGADFVIGYAAEDFLRWKTR